MQSLNEPNKAKKKWYKKTWGILLLSILVLYFGSALIVRFTRDPNTTKQAQSNVKEELSQPAQTADTPLKMPYKEVERWNSGSGRTIVIDRQHDNEASLTQLAKELNEENSTRDISWVYIYTDDTASLYRKESFCDPAQSARIRDFKQYWAALYQKDREGSRITIFEDRSCNIDAARKTIQL